MRILKYYLFLLFIFLIHFEDNSIVFAQDCCTALECNGPGEYLCQPPGGGCPQACCTGGGCPSYSCAVAGCDPENNNGVWECCDDSPALPADPPGSGGCSGHLDEWDTCYWDVGDQTCACQRCGGVCGSAQPPNPDDTCDFSCSGGSGGGGGGGASCDDPPAVPGLASPANGASFTDVTSISLDWNAPSNWGGPDEDECGSRQFQIQVDNNLSFASPELDATTGENTSVYPVTLPCTSTFATYNWRVRASNEDGNSAWSAIRNFQYRCFPPTATITTPAEAQVFQTNTNIYVQMQAADASTLANKKLKSLLPYYRWDHDANGAFVYTPTGPAAWQGIISGLPVGDYCGDNQTCAVGPGPLPNASTRERYFNIPHANEGFYQTSVNAESYTAAGVGCSLNNPSCKCTGNPEYGTWSTLQWSDCNASGADDNTFYVLGFVTGLMTAPANNSNFLINTSNNISARGLDPSGELNIVRIYYVEKFANGTYSSPPTLLGEKTNCTTSPCDYTAPFVTNNTMAGRTYVFYLEAVDLPYNGQGDRCSGHPNGPAAGWQDCGPNDNITVTVANNAPVCAASNSVTGLGSVAVNQIGYYNVQATENDYQAMSVDWSTLGACTLSQPVIDRIVVRAFGEDNNGVWPIMRVMGSDTNGVRTQKCAPFTVNNTVYQNKICDFTNTALNTIDIEFTNDSYGGSGNDVNLYVDYIDVYYADGSTPSRRIQSESNDVSADKVVYDRGNPGDSVSYYDGINVVNGSEAMGWSGALKFPAPLSFSTGGICTLRATVSDGSASTFCQKPITICGQAPGPANQLTPTNGATNVPYNNLTMTWSSGGWGSTCGAPQNLYTVRGKPKGTDISCSTDPAAYAPWGTSTTESLTLGTGVLTPGGTYCWLVQASNGEQTSYSAVPFEFTTENPAAFQNWMTAINGSVYADFVSMEFPDLIISPWNNLNPYLVHGTAPNSAQVVTNQDLEIETNGYDGRSQSGVWLKYAGVSDIYKWPATYTGSPPPGTTTIGGLACSSMFGNYMDPGKTYTADVGCVQTALDNLATNYSLRNNGISVIYITSGAVNANLIFGRGGDTFVSNSNAQRVVFVLPSNVNVLVSRDLVVSGVLTYNTPAQIQAAFVVASGITFEGVDEANVDSDPDGTVIVEGPIITKNAAFNRNRGTPDLFSLFFGNAYPGEIIRYNPLYLYQLTKSERTSTSANSSGLFDISVEWEIEE